MGMMVKAEKHFRGIEAPEPQAVDFFHQKAPLEHFFLGPDGNGLGERSEAGWRVSQIRFQQPVERQKRLVVKDDVIDVVERDLGFFQAIGYGKSRERGVVL